MEFKEFSLSENIKKAVEEQSFTEATDIQAQSIPLILEGKDIIGFSQTGSGKTAAYGLPALEIIDTELNAGYPQVLVLCPTRELAMQVSDELRKFSKYIERLHVVSVYGGDSISKQIGSVKSGCQIVVGTPGRIMDLIRRKVLKFFELKTVILDEADEMLAMGFREDIEAILDRTPEERQTLLFSATMPKAIIEITGKYQRNPVMVKIKSTQMTAVNIEQSYFEVQRGRKTDALSLLLQYYQPKLSLVFCNTKRMVDELTENLKARGFSAEGLHGDLKQSKRTQIMKLYKNGGFSILVATDVAARGIDVDDIDIVFNYDLPDESEYYVHRIGRTARGGKNGKSFTLIQTSQQYSALMGIAEYTHSEITKTPLPTVSEINKKVRNQFVEEIKETVSNKNIGECAEQLEALRAAGLDDAQTAMALIKIISDEKLLKKGTVDVPKAVIKAVPPVEKKKSSGRRVRVPNEKAAEKFKDVQMEKVTISIGKIEKVSPKHILGAVAGESGLPGSIMGTIDIHKTYTTIDVPKQYKTKVIKSLNQKKVKGKIVTVK